MRVALDRRQLSIVASVGAAILTAIWTSENSAFGQRSPAQSPPQSPVKAGPVAADIDDPKLAWKPCGGEAYEKGGVFLKGCEATVLRQDEASGALEMFVRTPKGFVWPAHWHSNAEHLIGIRGSTPVIFTDGTVHMVSAGDYLFIPNGTPHTGHCTDQGPCAFYLRTDKASDFIPMEKPAG
jgi:quercetin dioxygenase-like cupin family protein